jgi:hypothetical protein
MNPINEGDLLTLRAVAEALGVPHRRVRSWADAGTLDTLQPGRGAERLVPESEVRRLERAGYRVSWAALRAHPADAADPSHPVLDTETAIA